MNETPDNIPQKANILSIPTSSSPSTSSIELTPITDPSTSISDSTSIQDLINSSRTTISQPSFYQTHPSSFFNIPFFTYGNTINFYLTTKHFSNDLFKYPKFTIGPQTSPFLAVLSLALIFLPSSFIFICFTFKNIPFILSQGSLFLLLLFSLIYTFLINPGTVYYSDNLPYNTDEFNYCKHCQIYTHKKRKVVHCDICNVCCERFDHHCGVYGKCIGKGNVIMFYISVIGTCFVMCSIYGVIIYFIYSLIK